MISAKLVGQIRDLQVGYFNALESLVDIETATVKQDISFSSIYSTSRTAREVFDRLLNTAMSPSMQQEPVAELRCAVIGSSNHGKTSVLVEMFPDLAEQGFLITDVKDTTSQALVIKSGTRSDMTFHPWTLDQIRYLVDISRDDLKRRNIECQYKEDHIEIDGSSGDFEESVKSQFKFGVRQKLKPFANTYTLDVKDSENCELVARLTTKMDYSQKPKPKDIVVNKEAFNDLQFRTAVRSVEMESNFSEIHRWLGDEFEENSFIENLTFIDTPGLKAGGSDNDEVLRHVLSKKNQQIAVEMLKQDELDLIVHLVLCGQQSDFSTLWSHLEGVDSEILQDLGDRIIVAVNGFNVYFDNPDLAERWKDEGRESGSDDDHLNVTIQSNILSKMSERGAIVPRNICFLDVRRIVESRGDTYEEYYRERKKVAESWAEPNGIGYTTLQRLGILDQFKENIASIADPQDCGKGFLVRQMAAAWNSQGPKLIVRRFIVRNELLASIRGMKSLLDTYYDATGKMTRQSVTDALKSAMSFINTSKPDAIDRFCRVKIDPFIEKEVISRTEKKIKGNIPSKSWSVAALNIVVAYLFALIKAYNPKLRPEFESVLNQFLTAQLRECISTWGYSSVDLPFPTKEDKSPQHLLTHALKYHIREFLHKCLQVALSDDDLAGVIQSDEDKLFMKQLVAEISRLHVEAEKICSTHGVNIK